MTEPSVSRDDLEECWCCGGLHDSYRTLCPDCHEAGCSRFDDGCESDHQPVIADGSGESAAAQDLKEAEEILLDIQSDVKPETYNRLSTVYANVKSARHTIEGSKDA